MLSNYHLLVTLAALLGAGFFFLKWRQARCSGERVAKAVRSRSERELKSLREPKGHPRWLQSLAGACLESIEESQALEFRGEQRELFNSLLNEIGQGFLIVDRNLAIRFANQAVKGFFPALQEREDRRLIEVLLDHRLVDVVRGAVEGGERRSRQVRIERAGIEPGEKGDRVFEIEAAPLPGDAGAGCWVMISDVTESVMTEQVRKDFVANASHELRTPLTLINGYVETLEDGLIDDREAALKSLAVMRQHGGRIMRIVEDMLMISKLEKAESTLRVAPFDLRACVCDVVEHLATLVEKKNAVIELDFPEGDCVIAGDRFYWDQIFINLIENALKENQRAGLCVKVSFVRDEEGCVLSVSDDGVGIPRADLPYVFKRFYRGAKHHSQEVKGTGLGLSIVRRAVEAHGGKISVESRPGMETLFRITLPRTREGTESAPWSGNLAESR